MDDKTLLKELATFFLEEFSNNPGEIADWVDGGGHDADEFYAAVERAAL